MAGIKNSILSAQICFSARITGCWLVCIIAFFHVIGATKLIAQPSTTTNPAGIIESKGNLSSSMTPQQRAMIIKAAQALKNETAKAQAEYLAAYAPLTNPPVLNMSQVTNKSDLQVRRMKVREYLAAADRFRTFSNHLVEHLDEQIRTNVTDESIRKTLREGFEDFFGKIQLQSKVARQLEIQTAEEYLKALKFLEDNWDKWRPKTTPGSAPVFREPELGLQYYDIIRDINKLRAQQIEVRKQAMMHINQGPK